MIRASYKWRLKWPGESGRRGFLLSLAGHALAQGTRTPEVSAFDLSLTEEGVTPAELFFVREHAAAPSVDAPAWRLHAAGVSLSHAELLKLPRRAVAATLECAENPVGGGMVSHAEWEGVPLNAVIGSSAAGPWVRLTGYDGYTRTIPAAKALHPDTLIVHRMNAESLPASHGGPVRLLLPGWYGMDSVKWIQRIEFTDAPAESAEYRRATRSLLAGVQVGESVSATLVKSAFTRPIDGAWIRGRRFTVRGVAWAGERAVRSVAVSRDGGKSWSPAVLSPAAKYCWAHWKFEWKVPGAGIHTLLVRATDDTGAEQPLTRDSARADGYEQNACQRIEVTAL